jgi:hypothetical protein
MITPFIVSNNHFILSDINSIIIDDDTDILLNDAFDFIKLNYGSPTEVWRPNEVKQDASYLSEVTDFIKLNYKCEFNGHDNKCNLESKFGDKVPEKLQSILNESEKQKMSLSGKEQTAINNYKHFNYNEINTYLRDPTKYLSRDSKEDIQQLDNVFNKVSIPDDIVVYSGLRRIPKDINLNIIGNIFPIPEFTSSSMIPTTSYGFAQSGYMLEIEVPKGSKALYIGSGVSTNEKEVLINRGSTYEVIGSPEIKTIHNEFGDDNIKVVKVRLINDNKIGQDAAYLSDVADQIKLNYNCPDSEKVGSGKGSCGGGLKAIDELSSEEQDAILDYTKGLSNQISSLLIEGQLRDYEDPTNASSDDSPTKSTWKLIHTLDNAIENSDYLPSGSYYHGTDDASKYVEGEEIKYKTFMSVTDDIKTAKEFGVYDDDYHVLKINIPDGIKGIEVAEGYSGSDFPDMLESILPRDIILKVGKTYIDGNNAKITEVDVIRVDKSDKEK